MAVRPRILFVSEAVSIAHVARLSVLAGTLDAEHFDIHFASSGQFNFCQQERSWIRHSLESISPALFLERLASGKPVYSADEWRSYVRNELKLLETVKPDVVIGDFRLSLGISARKLGIRYLAVCNAHWSPYRPAHPMPAPDLPISAFASHRIIDPLFNAIWPLASRVHIRAANMVRKEYGLPVYASLGELYCDGDLTLYADSPTLTPTPGAPPSHRHIGPIVWSPALDLPDWWKDLPQKPRPVYITFGSTGKVDLLPTIVSTCQAENACAVVATAARGNFPAAPPSVYAAPFLPGDLAARASRLVIGNGGSATIHQALSEGRPVLGICSNLDQVLTMQTVAAAGAGEFMRASEASPERPQQALHKLLNTPSYATQAQVLQRDFQAYHPRKLFPAALLAALETPT